MKFKKIFVTGGAGYVGSALVPALLKKGYEVVVYDLYIYDYRFPDNKKLFQVKADIRDREKMIESSKGCDAFIHLACISNDPSFDLDPTLGKSINFDAFKNVIDACKENKIKRLVVASSTAQYGIKPEDVEVTENIEATP
jgi:nucleoside-diphosphate-sugar epimerase